jgi:hypothetical protein
MAAPDDAPLTSREIPVKIYKVRCSTSRAAGKLESDGRECREPSTLSHLGFLPVQKMPTIHVSSGFIRGIPAETIDHRERLLGPRW